jgi:hypothetical protein
LHLFLYRQYTAPDLGNLKESSVTKGREEIRTSAAGRSVAIIRNVTATLRTLGWSVREAAEHSAGTADVAAERNSSRKGVETRVHLVILCHSGSRVLFSEVEREVDDSVASYSIADDDLQQKRTLAEVLGETSVEPVAHRPAIAPRARAHAGSFRAEDAFPEIAGDAFLSIDAVLHDLFDHDLEVLADDVDAGGDANELLAPLTRIRHLVHAILVTDAPLTLIGDRTTDRDWLRVHRTRVAGAGGRWLDVVGAEGWGKYAGAVTKHYG